MRVVLLCIVSVATVALVAAQCTYTARDSSYYDLSSLARPENTPYSVEGDAVNPNEPIGPRYLMTFNFCGNKVFCGTGDNDPGWQVAAACQSWQDKSGSWHEKVIGRTTEMSITEGIDGPNNGVQVIYLGGETCANGANRTTQIVLECDSSVKGDPVIEYIGELSTCEYQFNIKSAVACPQQGDESIGDLSTRKSGFLAVMGGILISVLSVLALYCIIGIAYNRSRGFKGADQVPNSRFWQDLVACVWLPGNNR